MNLWGVGALFIALLAGRRCTGRSNYSHPQGPASSAYRRMALLGRLFGGGAGVVVVTIIYFMVFKPAG